MTNNFKLVQSDTLEEGDSAFSCIDLANYNQTPRSESSPNGLKVDYPEQKLSIWYCKFTCISPPNNETTRNI